MCIGYHSAQDHNAQEQHKLQILRADYITTTASKSYNMIIAYSEIWTRANVYMKNSI